MSSELITQAVNLIKAGQKGQARQLLLQALKTDPRQEAAWLWLVETLENNTQRIQALEQCLRFLPNSQAARRGLERFRAAQSATLGAAELPPAQASLPPEINPQSNAGSAIHSDAPEVLAPVKLADAAPQPAQPLPDRDQAPVQAQGGTSTTTQARPATEKIARPTSGPKKHARSPISKLEIGLIGMVVLLGIGVVGALIYTRLVGPQQQANSRHKQLVQTAEALRAHITSLEATATMNLIIAPTRIPSPSPAPTQVNLPLFTSTQTRSPSPVPTQANLPLYTSTQTRTPSPVPTQASTSAPSLSAPLLPAPLYFIADYTDSPPGDDFPGEDQIWRLDPDGATLTQVTQELWDVTGLDVNPVDGSLAYVSHNQLYLADKDGGNRRVFVTNDPLPEDWSNTKWSKELSNPRWSPDGTRLAYGLNGVNGIGVPEGQSVLLLESKIPPADQPLEVELYNPIGWSPDGQVLSIQIRYYEGSGVLFLNLNDNQITRPQGGFPCCDLAFTKDGKYVFSASQSGAYTTGGLRRMTLDTGVTDDLIPEQSGNGQISAVLAPVFASDGRLYFFYNEFPDWVMNREEMKMVSSSPDDPLRDMVTLREAQPIRQALWSFDARLAVVDSDTGYFGLLASDQAFITLPELGWNLCWGVIDPGWDPALIPTPTPAPTVTPLPTLATDSLSISPTNLNRLQVIRTFDTQNSLLISLALSPDGSLLAMATYDKFTIWNMANGNLLFTPQGHDDFVMSVAFSPDGSLLASGSGDTTIRLWDPGSGETQKILQGHLGGVKSLAFSMDGKYLVSGGSYPDQSIRVWDVATGNQLLLIEADNGDISAVAFSPDGSTIVSGDLMGGVRLWNAATGAELASTDGHPKAVKGVAFSPDGKKIASGGEDGVIRVWDVHTGDEIATLVTASLAIHSIAFSPDGRILAAAGQTLQFFDPVSGKELSQPNDTDNLGILAFSADGCYLAAGAVTILVWGVEP